MGHKLFQLSLKLQSYLVPYFVSRYVFILSLKRFKALTSQRNHKEKEKESFRNAVLNHFVQFTLPHMGEIRVPLGVEIFVQGRTENNYINQKDPIH